MPQTSEHCTIVDINAANLEESIRNPSLTALLDQGWSIEATLAVEAGDGPERIAMVLSPPKRDLLMLKREFRINTYVTVVGFLLVGAALGIMSL